MPTTYAHDLFGKQVYHQLPAEMKKVIRANGELYRIGLHGPDILFYFLATVNPVTQFGVKMHKEKARAFFEQGMEQVRETKDTALLAYLLGFGCHYLLDSSLHPYVNQTDDCGIASHTLLEKEFDRTLMERNGLDPFHYYPSDCIVPRKRWARVIHKAIPLIPAVLIHMSLGMMKWITNSMVCDDHGRRRHILSRLGRIAGKKKEKFFLDHYMAQEPDARCQEPVEELLALFEKTVKEAPGELYELFALSQRDFPLSERWNRTYNG